MNFTCIGRSHGAPAIPATREDWERLRNEPWLADMCRRIENGEEHLKPKLPIWTPHCSEFRNNHRSIRDALKPLQRLMLDFDEKGHSAEILEKSLRLQEEGRWTVLLVEDSVRRGTHVLVEIPHGMTAEEVQQRFSEDIGFQADGVVKDVSRCIYMVPMGHTLYVNEELFVPSYHVIQTTEGRKNLEDTRKDAHVDAPSPYHPERSEGSECTAQLKVDAPEILRREAPLDDKRAGEGFPTTYDSIPYECILEVLEEQMGGKPELGSRNNFIFAMACHLRYVCDDNPDWIAQVLPTYGEEREKWQQTIRSACNRSQTKLMPRIIQRTLRICQQRKAEAEPEVGSGVSFDADTPPPMPEVLPPLIRLLVSRTPNIYRPAVAHVLPLHRQCGARSHAEQHADGRVERRKELHHRTHQPHPGRHPHERPGASATGEGMEGRDADQGGEQGQAATSGRACHPGD